MTTITPPEPMSDATAQPRADSDALDWLIRRHGGAWHACDEQAFMAWLGADAAHPAAYARMQAEWTAFDALPTQGLDLLRANLADDLRRERQNADADAASNRTTARSPNGLSAPVWPRRRHLLTAALSVAGVAVAGGAAWSAWSHWQAQPLFAQDFATGRGQQMEVPLPDGSRLRLDTATQVKVTYYRHRREVLLPEGQAVFSVQGDVDRPFEVLAGPLRITVVGTRFSVRHTPGLAGAEGVRVAVESGRVRVEHRDAAPNASPLYLTAGQQVASDATGHLQPVEPVSSAGIAPWRDNRVSFDDTRLDQVLAELGRYGATGLVVHDPEVARLRITGTFNPTRMDSFARLLPQAAPVRIQGDRNVKEVVRAP